MKWPPIDANSIRGSVISLLGVGDAVQLIGRAYLEVASSAKPLDSRCAEAATANEREPLVSSCRSVMSDRLHSEMH